MTNLEHLIANGLALIADESVSPDEWRERMKKDDNWQGNEHITLEDLWTICQYVVCDWCENKYVPEPVRCENCAFFDDAFAPQSKTYYCHLLNTCIYDNSFYCAHGKTMEMLKNILNC